MANTFEVEGTEYGTSHPNVAESLSGGIAHATPATGIRSLARSNTRANLGTEEFNISAVKLETRAWWDCRSAPVRDPVIQPETVHLLSQVTFLSHHEIKRIDQLFSTVLEISSLIGEEMETRRTENSSAGTPVLSVRQLRRIPEFSQNVFLRRFVRVFSQTGDESLTLFELIDLYSALSPNATNQWKAWIAFCVFDFDEDGCLDFQDVFRTIRQMIQRTKRLTTTKLSPTDAAIILQAFQRGIMVRTQMQLELPAGVKPDSDSDPRICLGDIHEKDPLTGERDLTKVIGQLRLSMTESAKQKWAGLALPLHVTMAEQVATQVRIWQSCGKSRSPVEAYVAQMLGKCSGIREGVMDFRYFENALRKLPSFRFNFCVTISSPARIQSWISSSRMQRKGEDIARRNRDLVKHLETQQEKGRLRDLDQASDEDSDDETFDQSVTNKLSTTQKTQARLAAQIKKLDMTLEAAWHSSMLKPADKDFDSDVTAAVREQVGRPLPYGALQGVEAKGIRPPTIETRLKWVGLDMYMVRMVTDADGPDVDVDDWGHEGVESLLEQFSHKSKNLDSARYIIRHRLKKWFHQLHHALWETALSDVDHKFGHGVAELARIMKWLFMLNLGLSAAWFVLVIFPRDFDIDNGRDGWGVLWHLYSVLELLFSQDNDESSLYYSGFERKQGFFYHMDMMYLIAIVGTTLISLAAMLSKLSKNHLSAKDLANGGVAEGGVEWVQVFAQYDFSQTDEAAAAKMRQTILLRIEDWRMEEKERQSIHSYKSAGTIQHLQHEAKGYLGKFLTVALIVTVTFSWLWLLKHGDELKEYHVLLAPAVLSALNSGSPVIIKEIVALEGRFRAIDRMETCIRRIFAFKILQLTAMFYSILTITNLFEIDGLTEQEMAALGDSTSQTDGESVAIDESFGKIACPEDHAGMLFMKQLIVDSLVWMIAMYGRLAFTKLGVPRFWQWRNIATRFEAAPDAVEKNGYRLESRWVNPKDRMTSLRKVLGKQHVYKPEQRWYKLMPHQSNRHQKHGLISMMLDHFTKEGLKEENFTMAAFKRCIDEWTGAVESELVALRKRLEMREVRVLVMRARYCGVNVDTSKLMGHHKAIVEQVLAANEVSQDPFTRDELEEKSWAALLELGTDLVRDFKMEKSELNTAVTCFRKEMAALKDTLVRELININNNPGMGHDQGSDTAHLHAIEIHAADTTSEENISELKDAVGLLETHIQHLMSQDVPELQRTMANLNSHRTKSWSTCGRFQTVTDTKAVMKMTQKQLVSAIVRSEVNRSAAVALTTPADIPEPEDDVAAEFNNPLSNVDSAADDYGSNGDGDANDTRSPRSLKRIMDVSEEAVFFITRSDRKQQELEQVLKEQGALVHLRHHLSKLPVAQLFQMMAVAFEGLRVDLGNEVEKRLESSLRRTLNPEEESSPVERAQVCKELDVDRRLNELDAYRSYSWRNHNHYRNTPVESWVYDIKVRVTRDPALHSTSKKGYAPRTIRCRLNRETRNFLNAGLRKRDIHNVGEMLDSHLTDDQWRNMMPHSRPMPSGVLAAIRRAQGHWIDVTEEVRRQRWWRPQPEELSHEESATFIIGMLWRQTFVWVGSPFCPWLPVIGCITTALCFFAMKHAMLHGAYRAPDQPWASGDTQNIFMLYGMVTLLVNVVPITVWLNQAPACGPHAGFMVTETMTLFEQENLWPHLPEYDVDYHFLGVSMNPAKLFQLSSFLIHYILDSTCLVLVVVYLWSRGELRFIHLMESRAREMISQHQTVCDTRYLKMRLREARKRESDGNQTVMDAGIQEEQQKLHQYIVAMMGASAEDDLKVTGSIALTKESTHPGGTASLDNQVFARVVTRSWALDSAAVQWVESIGADGTRTTKTLEDLGLEGNFSAEVGQNHDSVVWLTVDTSIPNHTKFTLRLNDKVMSNPGMHQHRANKKKGVEVRAAELSFHEVLHFEIPPDLCPKYNGRSDGWMARVTIEAGLLSQKDKLGHLLRPNALKRAPKYSFKLELFNTSEDVTHPCSMSKMSGNGTGLLVVPERPDAIASGLAALNRPTATELVAVDEVLSTRPFWQVYVDYWRESHDRTDETGMPINSAVVIEYMVEVRQVRFIVDANGHGKPTIDDSLHAEARRQRHKLHGRKIKPKVEVLKVFAQEWRTFPHFTNMHAAIRTCLAIDKQEALPKLPPKYHKSHFTLGNENLRTKKFYDDRRYRLELYMNEMLNTPEVGARANPYFLGLCGMLGKSDKDFEVWTAKRLEDGISEIPEHAAQLKAGNTHHNKMRHRKKAEAAEIKELAELYQKLGEQARREILSTMGEGVKVAEAMRREAKAKATNSTNSTSPRSLSPRAQDSV